MIIGFLAKKRHGKDTACNYIVKKYGYKKMSFAYPLKNAVKHLFGFTDNQVNGNQKEIEDIYWGIKPRKALQFIGTDVVRNQFPQKLLSSDIANDFWIKRFDLWYKNNCENNIVISDVRFQNEVDYIHSLGGFIIKIERTVDIVNDDIHESELEIDKIKDYDRYILNNSSFKKLYSELDKTIQSF